MLKVIKEQTGGIPQNILEAACGGGRISIPLARAGHNVTGFDADEHMLLRFYRRMKDIPNISCYHADALESGWGSGFDIVVLAGNVLINIETVSDYMEAQKSFIRRAASALRTGGHLYLDYDQHSDTSAAKCFSRLGESTYFKGTDELGTTGRTVTFGGAYDPVTRIWSGIGHWELTANNGERFTYSHKPRHKHIPAMEQVFGWLSEAGLAVGKTFRNYTDEPLAGQEADYVKAVIWAEKR